ncbi:type II toxin-antitoxin system HicB family antitoxin [Streptococcus sp. 121]|uniref:type II toxin-antitoxin system HicB family antitoxin n=1 Tax=Streptococcus sp. 121 TaxID=2797637 RepID=UPI0018F09A88|nr:type II toxin-antitoxin system HicB family antitoxin [Streptococcus sp. 121]MBJ6746387.1 type II toxin-antitoxin system HicB family antitoxin [Streptococcus sp. 121]
MKYTYLALFEEDIEQGGYSISFPDFPGAISEASNLKEAQYNAREVLEIFTIMFEDEERDFPNPSSFKALASKLVRDGDIIQAITVDTELVRERELSKKEDKLDYERGIQALEDFEMNPVTYSIDDIVEEFEKNL